MPFSRDLRELPSPQLCLIAPRLGCVTVRAQGDHIVGVVIAAKRQIFHVIDFQERPT